MYACVHIPDFPVQALLRQYPQSRRSPVAVLEGETPLEEVFATNALARQLGVVTGMSRLQASAFHGLQIYPRDIAQEQSARRSLLTCAATFSPRKWDCRNPMRAGLRQTAARPNDRQIYGGVLDRSRNSVKFLGPTRLLRVRVRSWDGARCRQSSLLRACYRRCRD